MSGEMQDPGSEDIQEPITKEQYYRQHAAALSAEHAGAFLRYKEAADAGARNLNSEQANLDDVELRMKKKAEEARQALRDPDLDKE